MPLIVEEILLIVKVLQLGHFRKRTAVWNSTFWCSFLFPSTADVKSKDNNFHTLHISSCHLPLMWRRKKTLFIGRKSDHCLSLSLNNSLMLWRLEWCGSGWEWCQLLDANIDAIITMVERRLPTPSWGCMTYVTSILERPFYTMIQELRLWSKNLVQDAVGQPSD